jgi:crotonobetainyl-CoA:carnitine CoA-transferase CaiB-like acyl-CoA transferase
VGQLGEAFMEYAMNGKIPNRHGNSQPHFVPYGVYPCDGNDSWVTITVTSDAEWLNFKKAIGEEWADDSELETVIGRLRHRKQLDAAISEWTRSQNHHAVMHLLQAAGVACGAVHNTREIATDPHLRERGFFPISNHQAPVGPRPHLGPLFNLKGVKRLPDRLASTLGQYNRYVLCDLVGLGDDDYDALMEANIIGETPANPSMTQPPKTADLLRMGFIAEHDTDYKKRLRLESNVVQQKGE